MTTTRELPQAEWSRLAGTEIGTAWQSLPLASRVLVAETDGAIVGHWVLMPVWHVEWLRAPNRSAALGLYRGLQALAADLNLSAVYTAAIDEPVRRLLARVGALKLPGDHYLWPFRKGVQ